tara:strand:- start:1905 stop:2354 length:450 start_codon:yes stop_codon:yes gene_type:complete
MGESKDKDDINEMEDLLKALENEINSSILELTNADIKTHKNNILQMAQIKGKKLKEYHKKLKNYRYVRGMHDLQFGYYIRWIPLKNPEKVNLTRGAHITGIEIANDDIMIQCKTTFNVFFNIKFGECIIFQKITDQERLILKILDVINK